MPGKPTNEKLKHKIQELEKEVEGYREELDDLREREKKYRALVETTSDWINEVDLNSIYKYVNPTVKDVLGYLPEEIIGKSILDFIPQEEVDHTLEFFKEITGAGKSFSGFINTHIRKDGRRIILESNGAPFFDSSGNLVGYWGLGRDVTDRIRAEEELRTSEAKWRSLVENAPNIILILDSEGTIQFLNRAVEGYSVEEAIGRSHLDYIAPEYHKTVQDAVEKVFSTGEPTRYTLRGIGPEGRLSWYETQVGPLENKGRVDAVILITTDITEQKDAEESLRKAHEGTEKQVQERTAELLQTNKALQAEIFERERVEESLQDSEQRFRSLVEATSDMVWEMGLDGRYTYVSPKSEDLLGYKPEDILGNIPFELMSMDEAKRCTDFFVNVSETHSAFSGFESVVTRKDGRRINVETSAVLILDADGNHIGYRGLDKDITERVRSREQMFQAAKMVSLGTLVSGVAHEINNPITSIMLNSPILHKIWNDISPVLDEYCEKNGDIRVGSSKYTQLRERVPVLLSDITEGTKRVKKIVDELKNFSRQKPSDLSEDVDINEAIKTAVGLVSNLIKKATKHFKAEYYENIPLFKGNIQRIEQVAINLIINACEALSNSECATSVSTSYDANSDSVVMSINDEGEGILPEVLERIGDPFFTTKRDTGGTGLGLAITSRIIEDHAGTIEFYSVPGEGTTVKVMIPASHTVND